MSCSIDFFFNVTVASEANLGWWGLLDFKYQNFDKQKKKKIMVTVMSSLAKTELPGEGLSVNRRSNRQRSIIPS